MTSTTLKKIQSEMKDSKNTLQGNNSRVDKAEYQINDLEIKKQKKKT